MNRKGLELLLQNDLESKELETLLKKEILSDDFKLFLKYYKVGQSWLTGNILLLNEESGDTIGLTQLKMFEPDNNPENYHACVDYIFEYTRLLEEIEKYEKGTENWNDLGFVQIGLIHWSDVLLIGVENANKGEIWRYGTGIIGNHCSKLDNNIFAFISRLYESLDEENIADYNLNTDHIYKNLNETFWRIKTD